MSIKKDVLSGFYWLEANPDMHLNIDFSAQPTPQDQLWNTCDYSPREEFWFCIRCVTSTSKTVSYCRQVARSESQRLPRSTSVIIGLWRVGIPVFGVKTHGMGVWPSAHVEQGFMCLGDENNSPNNSAASKHTTASRSLDYGIKARAWKESALCRWVNAKNT